MNAPESKFGRYRLLREIGRGAFGTVHLAEDSELGRQVALKIFTTLPGIEDPDASRRLRREVEALSRLESPGVSRIYETGVEAGCPYIAMRHVEGRTLAALLAGDQELSATPATTPEDFAARTHLDRAGLLAAIASGARTLHQAHGAGVIHGDLKPANLMVTPQGQCVILDFGVSRLEAEGPPGTDEGGTLPYMAPERFGGGGGPAIDIWSMGATLFEALAGRPPFAAPTQERLIAAILADETPDLKRGRPYLPGDLVAIVERCLEKSTERRYATALDLADDLERYARGEPVRARRAGAVRRLWMLARRRRAMAFLIVFLPVALGAGLLSVAAARREESRLLELAALGADHARDQSEEAGRLLASFLKLSDIQRFQDLDRRASRLWPLRPEIIPELEQWLADAAPLAQRLDERRAALAALRLGAHQRSSVINAAQSPAVSREITDVQERMAALSAKASEAGDDPRAAARLEATLSAAEVMAEALGREAPVGESWEYNDPNRTFEDQVLSHIVAGLEHLQEPDPHRSTITSVRERIEQARTLRVATVDAHLEEWDRAIASIADPAECSAYAGLRLSPQPGLVPLGRDLGSGLWEFHHVGSGERPVKEGSGRWMVGDDCGIVLVLIPGGTATLGARLPREDHPAGSPFTEEAAEIMEGPVHLLDLAPFFLSKYEMTQGQWLRASGKNPSGIRPPRSGYGEPVTLAHPVESVSWREATEVLWHLGLSLPTEAQWEYATRGGTTGPRWTGDDPRSLAGAVNAADQRRRAFSPTANAPEWLDDGFADHAPVGGFRANPFGLFDVYGNVWEWCRDAYGTYRDTVFQEKDGELLGLTVDQRVYRGGGAATPYQVLRSAKRNAFPPSSRSSDLGLRPARAVE